ncbi:MAG: low molecular weight phosphotyrosine protein phosphatase [Chitinivibrionia bacterium]|nr:low molecular weight phosphotyrosine protein phosphatase [Chitinivibrionia bacterium]
MKKILFVCLGNICRSPAAEAIFNALVKKNGLENRFSCDSSGTLRKSIAIPAEERMVSAAKRRNIFITHSSRLTQRQDFEKFDYIVAMDDNNVENLEKIKGEFLGKAKILKMAQFLENKDVCVPDPYCGDIEDFEYALDLLEIGCKNLLEYLRNL